MTAASACPDAATCERLRLGQLASPEVERLAQHLECCPTCAARVAGWKIEDVLLAALRAGARPADRPEQEVVSGLIARLKRMPAAAGSVQETTVSAATVAPGPPGAVTEELGNFLAPARGPGEIGRLGGYRVLRLLGTGGMGMVFHAQDVQLQRPIALKVMKPELAKNPTARERFLREARAAARLKSDHVVTIHQVGEEGSVVFLAMEYLEGVSLDDWLRTGHRPTTAQAARIGRQIALGLAAAHECGLIHRDVKPGNVWLESRHQGRVKLLDFGLARPADDHQLTQSGMIVGTPAYMAPEQARGEKVDHRADLFSLGVVLYRLTTGRLPFRGDNTLAVLTALAVDTPAPPRELNPGLPPRLAALIERLLSKDREQRPQSAKAVAAELAAVEREGATTAVPVASPAKADEPTIPMAASVGQVGNLPAAKAGRKPAPRMLAAAGLLVLLAGIAAVIVVIVRDKSGREVGRLEVPKGGSAETREEEKSAPRGGPYLDPEPLAPAAPGEAISRSALVSEPARVAGVRSWTIAPREAWNPTALAYRPDGRRLAVASWDNSVHVWEPQTGRLVQVLFGFGPRAIAWSPDGRVLAGWESRARRSVLLRDAETGRHFRSLESPVEDSLFALAWSPDGRLLRAWMEGGTCLTWQVADGKLLHHFPLGGQAAAFAPDAKRLAGSEGNRVRIWDPDSGEEKESFTASSAAWRLAWSPDGTRLAATCPDGLNVWDVQTGARTVHHPGPLNQPDPPAWSADSRSVAVNLEGNRSVALVDVVGGKEPLLLGDGSSPHLAWAPDGQSYARAGGYPWVRIYDAATRKRQRTLTEGPSVDGMALSADGQTLAVWEPNLTSLVSTDTGQLVARLEGTPGPAAWSPDGKHLATPGPDNVVVVRDPAGKVLLTLAGDGAPVTSLAWSTDGKRLASTALGRERVLVWNMEKGERDGKLSGGGVIPLGHFPGGAEKAKWSRDGRLLIFNVPEVGWHVWDLAANRPANDPREWQAVSFELAPDGRSALVARKAGEPYRLCDLETGKERARLPYRYEWYLSSPSWSPDGRLLLVPVPGAVELWRADLVRRVRVLRGLGGGHPVVMPQDGRFVAGLWGERLYVWEPDTGRLRGRLLLARRNNALALTPEGHYTGNDQVERGIVVVVQKDDGTQELLEPADFEKRYGWKNDPDKVHLLRPLPPASPPQGQPLGPFALVREPADLADPAVTSWTVETLSPRMAALALAYRPDGKLLATGSDDGAIRIWDTTSGELVRVLVGDPAGSLSWSPDGKVLAAAGARTPSVSLWEAGTGRLLRRFSGGRFVTWSPDGRTLAALDMGQLLLWDAAPQRVVASWKLPAPAGQSFGWHSCAWSPDGKTIVVCLQDKIARLWDVALGAETRRLEVQDGSDVHVAAWSPDGKRIVTTTMGARAFHVWEAATGKLQGRYPVEGDVIRYPRVAWAPDGTAVAVEHFGLFDPDTGKRIRGLDVGNWVSALAWSPDGKQVATAGHGGLRLHEAASGKRNDLAPGLPTDGLLFFLTWSPDGRRLGLGWNVGSPLRVVDAATGERRPAPQGAGVAGAWSPDGKTLATATADGTLRLWDAVTNQPVRTLEGRLNPLPGSLAWSADGKRVAGGGNQHLWAWSAETGKLLWHNDKHGRLSALAWSPDGEKLASADPAAARIWEAGSGRLLLEKPLPSGALAWSPDGKTLAIGAPMELECALLDTASGQVRVTVSGGVPRWSADGTTVTTLHPLGLRVWDAATGQQRRNAPLSWPAGGSEKTWSPDGRLLALYNDYEIHLSDAEGQLLGVLLPFDVYGQLAVAPDGCYRGNARVERQIRMVVQKRDGSSETLTPAEFQEKYGFKNDPEKVRLLGE